MVASRVAEHYGRDQPIERIRAQLAAAGHELADLRAGVLAGVDEFHLGGRLATMELIASMQLTERSAVLDVGCGIGGAARTIVETHGCTVTGVDLTPAFVDTARQLTELVGMDITFEVADATALPFDDHTFDAVTMLHVGMNIADKMSLFTELARVLRPQGGLHVYDIMRVEDGDIAWPVPWSTDASTSFVEFPDDYLTALRAAGLEPGEPVDRLELVQRALASASEHPPAVDLSHLMGPEWPTMFGNLRAALQAGIVRPFEIVAHAMADS